MRAVLTVVAICCVVLGVGCSALRSGVDMGLEAREAYEARKSEEQARKERERVAAEQERARIEADRLANAQAAEDAREAADAAKYADGPNTLEHGRRGFLWKPISDNTGKPVLILPPRFTHKTRLVTVDGVALKRGSVANGYREHYRMKQHYASPVTIQAEASDGIGGIVYRWTWVVQDPSKRQDSNITPRKDAI